MQARFRNFITRYGFALVGIALIFILGVSFRMRIGPISTWGPKRIVLAILVVLCLFAYFYQFRHPFKNRAIAIRGYLLKGRIVFEERFKSWFSNQSFGQRMKRIAEKINNYAVTRPSYLGWFEPKKHLIYYGLVIICVGTLAGYVWVFTGGHPSVDGQISTYFDKQATAYIHGSLYLLEKPSAEFAALHNPYDYYARQNTNYLWDAAYFNNKYYLYWGPVPALLIVPIKILFSVSVEDQYLVLAFVSGTFLLLSLFLVKMWQLYFSDQTGWPVIVGSLIIGMGLPSLWLINQARIYEAAVAAGQFWLVGGILFLLISLSEKRLFLLGLGLSSVCFACAVGSRVNLVLAVVSISVFVLLWICKGKFIKGGLNYRLLACLAYFTPLIIGAAGLLAYNYARFGEPFEFGMRYVLTGSYYNGLQSSFSPVFIIPNLYKYLFHLPSLSPKFPFLVALNMSKNMWPSFIHLPQYLNFHEPTTGILIGAPVVLFSLAGIWETIQKTRFFLTGEAQDLHWSLLFLVMAFALPFILIMSLFFSTMRYMEDFMPILYTLSMTGVWVACSKLSNKPGLRGILILLFLILASITIIIGFMNGMTLSRFYS